ncbi:hypothetical protein BDF14DRAFT_1999502 [Spinellus fusiger]|nr:hypothetical protein BDF14DRAFT_1999502 [Spinellus fusiger]
MTIPPSSLSSRSPKIVCAGPRPPRVLRKRKQDQVSLPASTAKTLLETDSPAKKHHRTSFEDESCLVSTTPVNGIIDPNLGATLSIDKIPLPTDTITKIVTVTAKDIETTTITETLSDTMTASEDITAVSTVDPSTVTIIKAIPDTKKDIPIDTKANAEADTKGDAIVKAVKDIKNDTTKDVKNNAKNDTISPQLVPAIWCRHCGITHTCRWRYGPLGKQTLCNACHLRWKGIGKCVEGYNHVTYPPPPIAIRVRKLKGTKAKKARVNAPKSEKKLQVDQPTTTAGKKGQKGVNKATSKLVNKTLSIISKKVPSKVVKRTPPKLVNKTVSRVAEKTSVKVVKKTASKALKKTVEKESEETLSSLENSECLSCGAASTKLWRRRTHGPKSFCNTCGQRWYKKVHIEKNAEKSALESTPELVLESESESTPESVLESTPESTPESTVPLDSKSIFKSISKRAIKVATKKKQSKTSRSLSRAVEEILDTDVKEKDNVEEEEEEEEEHTPPPPLILLHKQKKFLKAAMYSHHYKHSVLPVKYKSASKTFTKKFTFSLPIHQGAILLDKCNDFQLPPNILEEYSLGMIGKFGACPTPMDKPTFTRLRANIFVERKPNRTEQQAPCQCLPPADSGLGCGDDCLNRMLYYECEPKTCPCMAQCSNQRFQRKEGTKGLEIFLTRERGWGLRTLVNVKRGDLIVEYRGEVISHKTCEERMRTLYKNQKNFYFLDYQNGEVVDACTKGTEARFINHSCDPNCHIEKWALKGELAVGVFASRDISANSELFYDYNFSVFGNPDSQQLCYCGSDNCRGSIGKKPALRASRITT